MKNFLLILTAAMFVSTMAFAKPLMEGAIKQPTDVDVPGCTFYKMVDNKVVCSAVWKQGYKASQRGTSD